MSESVDDTGNLKETPGSVIVPTEEDDEFVTYAKRIFSPVKRKRERRLFRAFWHSAPAIALGFFLPVAAHAYDFCGTVISVVDGDTEWVHTTTGQNVKIRLHIADAPEVRHNSKQVDQPYGPEAAYLLSSLTLHKTVCANIKEYSWARPVVDLTVGNLSVNDEMIRQGDAWVWVPARHARPKAESDLEAEAQAAGRGLWALPADQRIPPWEWRKEHRIR